jgi:site-specific DNA recombinase
MKIGIYIRVSTEEQKTKGISIDDQKIRGIEFCETRGYTYEIFNDAGFSGSLPPEERPSLNRMLEQIYLEEIDGIYVVDFDRITRDEKFGFVLKKILIDNKVKLFDTSGEINLLDETQDLLLGIKILLSSFELKRLKVRIKRNLLRSVKEGNVGGGPMLNYGFKKGENKKLVIDEVEAEVVKLIFQLSIEGKGTKVIANFLNDQSIPTKRMTTLKGYLKVKGENKVKFLWRDAVIHKILTNTIYKGKRLYKGEYYDCAKIIVKLIILSIIFTIILA